MGKHVWIIAAVAFVAGMWLANNQNSSGGGSGFLQNLGL
jgi:hypothetical protein